VDLINQRVQRWGIALSLLIIGDFAGFFKSQGLQLAAAAGMLQEVGTIMILPFFAGKGAL
jgi:hypothetical protein